MNHSTNPNLSTADETDSATGDELFQSTSVIIVTCNHREEIGPCLRSILANDPQEVIVVDNDSSDGTTEYISTEFDRVQVVEMEENVGFGSGIERGVRDASGTYLLSLNPDSEVVGSSFSRLLEPIQVFDDIITTPKTLLKNKHQINVCGLIVHFTGLSFTRGYQEKPTAYDDPEFVTGVSGVCFAMAKETYEKLGGFDENIFLYMDDTELSWRAKASGVSVLYVPDAIVQHEYGLDVDSQKLYFLEVGRYYLLRKYFTWREYLLLAPSFIATEILTWGYAILDGRETIEAKCNAVADGLTTPVEKYDCDRRALLAKLDVTIPAGQLSYSPVDYAVKKVANVVYKLNRLAVDRFL